MEVKAEAKALSIGATLQNGKFRIDRILGQGGFGITYLATDLSLDRLVAIKEFFPKTFCNRNDVSSQVSIGTTGAKDIVDVLKAKFIKEAKNVARFNIDSIIKILTAFEENGTAYYVMDYIDGETLSERIRSRGPLSEKDAEHVIEEIGRALTYVHAQRINHLDVKPGNIMMRFLDNKPILIDFGLSKRYDEKGHQTSNTPVGVSHGYAPPEQYKNEGVSEFSPTTDVYSLAATLYFILTGEVPPAATSLIENDLIFPPNFPQRFVPAIKKAMSPKRHDRQQSIEEFISDLKSGNVYDDELTEPVKTPSQHQASSPSPIQPITPIQPIIVHKPERKKSSGGKSSGGKGIIIGLIIALLLGGGVFVAVKYFDSFGLFKKVHSQVDDQPEADVTDVEDVEYTNPYGETFIYTGKVKNGEIPHGKGEGRNAEGTYTGEYANGLRQGDGVYVTRDGSNRFEGTFNDDKYSEGTLYWPRTGHYFVGTFTDNEMYNGTIYDSTGKFYMEIQNGAEYNDLTK